MLVPEALPITTKRSIENTITINRYDMINGTSLPPLCTVPKKLATWPFSTSPSAKLLGLPNMKMYIRIATTIQIGIVSVANMPDAAGLSVFTGVVGLVGAVAITLVLVLVYNVSC